MLAHQGGWDEILLVLGPILVIAGLLRLAKQRVDADQPTPEPGAAPDDAFPHDRHDNDRHDNDH